MIRIELLKAIHSNLNTDERFTVIIAKPMKGGYELEINSDMDKAFVSLLLAALSNMIDNVKEDSDGYSNQTKH